MLSTLGDRLNVEIDLVSVSKEELSTWSARLSGAEAYKQANLQYNPALVGARVTVERRPSGQPYVKITSSRPVNEPFIDVLLEITSSSGRLVREYTVLVDPPGTTPPPAVAAAAPSPRPAPAPAAPPLAPPAPAAGRPAPLARAGARRQEPCRGVRSVRASPRRRCEGVRPDQAGREPLRDREERRAGRRDARADDGRALPQQPRR